jgi:hypothetical protein
LKGEQHFSLGGWAIIEADLELRADLKHEIQVEHALAHRDILATLGEIHIEINVEPDSRASHDAALGKGIQVFAEA